MKYDKNMKMFTFEEGSNIMVVTLFQNVYVYPFYQISVQRVTASVDAVWLPGGGHQFCICIVDGRGRGDCKDQQSTQRKG